MSENYNITPRLIVTIPVMDEVGYIENCINAIRKQGFKNYHVIICVNQPEHWWADPQKRTVCENNMATIDFLKSVDGLPIEIVDQSSPGKGFLPGEKGVGHARNILFDRALCIAENKDLIMCLDADSIFEPGYFQSVIDVFSKAPDAVAHANPYYHSLTGNENVDRAILRYEIYMRLYVLNLWRIGSPYAFTPLGSVITADAKSLKAIGKIAPKTAGEDFYLLQKLRKHGRITQYNEHYVYPSSRISERVPFGTGPAVADGMKNNWKRYPVYPVEPFDIIKQTYDLFPALYRNDLKTPMDEFFNKIFGTKNIFQPLRSNSKTLDSFIRASHIKIDGLRIMQFVRNYHQGQNLTDERNILKNLEFFLDKNKYIEIKYLFSIFNFKNISISLLQNLRNILTHKELDYRKKDFYEPQLSF